ncbi:uncharacterized protein LOC117302698 [Asterias rubens]|uniref:uncharacterized protein LOC117302698 n=1 Tax=Asterias rubens TaxID=7604 RepID=UPI001454F361|nr:uncharacterized protein LOC117302698 [Asterias rubens]
MKLYTSMCFCRTQMHSHGLLCLDVHAVHWNLHLQPQPVSYVQRRLRINITATSSQTTVPGREAHEPQLQLETSEGQVIQFGGLRIRDSDSTEGMYRVKVSVDHGGMLSVKQDENSNVIFYPKESGSPEWEPIDNLREYEQLDRFENFYEHYEAPDDEQSRNNGKKNLMFVGSLDGINRVLSSMVFVPWCPQWPTPPNWNIPESSWMDPSSLDQMLSDEPLKPAIWPQWYPRFWYPFPRKTWTWWPRVMPPWWMNQSCSDWTSRIHVETQEITPETCDAENEDDQPDVSHWFADVRVNTRHSEPKSLITDNLFTYFPDNARSFLVKNLYIRSKEEFFQLRIDLEVVEKELATIRNTGTNRPSFSCSNVAECTEKLQKIEVTLRDGVSVQDVCKITIEIRMYKDNSERLSDYMMLWGYKSVSECINYMHHDQAMSIAAPELPVIARQGEANIPLGITYSSLRMTPSGILHAKIYAEHGLVSVTTQDGLRVYMDHIGQHERIPTYLCIAGPADMVIAALLSATFTPFKNFKGRTSVKVDYRIPSTAMRETFRLDVPPPMKRLTVDVQVVNGERPLLPLLLMPTKVCISEMQLLPLDMMRIEGRYREDEFVTMSLVASKGQLLLEEQRIPEIYECPAKSPHLDDEDSLCTEECSYHTACPGTKMCCYQGCSRVCMEPQMVATVNALPNSTNVFMHGKISTLNRVLEAENLFYLPKPCQTHDTGPIMTEHDTVRIEIISSRNPEGNSLLQDLSVDIVCKAHIEKAFTRDESSEECTEEWGDWLDCELEGERMCGRGSQIRRRRCGLQTLTQSRPCLVCGCNPIETVIPYPVAHVPGCALDNPVMRCPPGCDVEASHMEDHSFSCVEPLDGMVQKIKSIEVHDICICESCLRHRQ